MLLSNRTCAISDVWMARKRLMASCEGFLSTMWDATPAWFGPPAGMVGSPGCSTRKARKPPHGALPTCWSADDQLRRDAFRCSWVRAFC